MWAHLIPLIAWALSLGIGGLVASIIVLMTKGKESNYVRIHVIQQMIFQFLLLLAGIAAFALKAVLIGYLLVPLVIISGLVFPILGALRAKDGREYALPVAGHMAARLRH